MVLARIIEPPSKLDGARVLEETGVVPVSYPVVCRQLRVYARDSWRTRLSAAYVVRTARRYPTITIQAGPTPSPPTPSPTDPGNQKPSCDPSMVSSAGGATSVMDAL